MSHKTSMQATKCIYPTQNLHNAFVDDEFLRIIKGDGYVSKIPAVFRKIYGNQNHLIYKQPVYKTYSNKQHKKIKSHKEYKNIEKMLVFVQQNDAQTKVVTQKPSCKIKDGECKEQKNSVELRKTHVQDNSKMQHCNVTTIKNCAEDQQSYACKSSDDAATKICDTCNCEQGYDDNDENTNTVDTAKKAKTRWQRLKSMISMFNCFRPKMQ